MSNNRDDKKPLVTQLKAAQEIDGSCVRLDKYGRVICDKGQHETEIADLKVKVKRLRKGLQKLANRTCLYASASDRHDEWSCCNNSDCGPCVARELLRQ